MMRASSSPHHWPLASRLLASHLVGASGFGAGALALIAFVPSVWAQEEVKRPGDESGEAKEPKDAQPSESEPVVVAPQLIEEALAPYPAAAREAGVEGSVVLKLTIDAEGKVSEAAVAQGLGHGLNEAAQKAALGYRFTPATQDGRPTSARILFQVEFALPQEEQEKTPVAGGEVAAAGAPLVAVEPQAETPFVASEEVTSGRDLEGEDLAELEVIVRGHSRAEELRRSPLAVQVVELKEAKHSSDDLGEVLARSTGVTVQRAGGLGSRSSFSMAGLSGDRVRFFMDGVPLKFVGFSYGVANVPVNLIDSVELYQGVVPVSLGADALGGAVNLVTDRSLRKSKAQISYQLGSFSTQRLTGSTQYFHADLGLTARATGFLDSSKNNYPVSVDVTNSDGSRTPAEVPLSHSGYLAGGGALSLGLVDKKWAEKILLSGFVTTSESEVPFNATMKVPYGEVEFSKLSGGANLRYAHWLSEETHLDITGGYSLVTTQFMDVGTCRYGWRGDCFVDLAPIRGEIAQIAIDRQVKDHAGFLRANLGWALSPSHDLRASLAPTIERREGEDTEIDEEEGEYDPLSALQAIDSLVAGSEWEFTALQERLGNILFAKIYSQNIRSEELLGTGETSRPSRSTLKQGFGDSARLFLDEDFYLKASYEYATRLPSAEEVFGDGRLLISNIELEPETSHNLNLGVFEDALMSPVGTFAASSGGFARLVEGYINQVPSATYSQYLNIDSVRSLGIEGRAGWSSLRDVFALEASFTWQDLRNTSDEGSWADYEGDRVPNHPYLTGAAYARIRIEGVTSKRDFVELSWWTRYVHSYLLGWKSLGDPDLKLEVPSQLTHSLTLSHVIVGEVVSLSHSIEAQNLTNEEVYDFYGVQRPGRSFYYKFTLDYQ